MYTVSPARVKRLCSRDLDLPGHKAATLLLCLGSPSCHCMWYIGIFGFVIKLVFNTNCYQLWF